MFGQPEVFQVFLDRIADAVGDHLQAQIDAGAAGVQLFDTWAGALTPDDFRRWALPASRRALARASGAPRMFFTKDSAPFLPWLGKRRRMPMLWTGESTSGRPDRCSAMFQYKATSTPPRFTRHRTKSDGVSGRSSSVLGRRVTSSTSDTASRQTSTRMLSPLLWMR